MILTKVVATNGSAKMEKGNTALVLAPFLDGVKEAGASVELFYAKRLNVKPCAGEFHYVTISSINPVFSFSCTVEKLNTKERAR